MNSLRIKRRRILLLSSVLAGQLGAGAVTSSLAHAQPAATADGKALVFDRGKGNCLSCHAIQGGDLPGTIGPPLNDMKVRFPNRSDLVGIISDETKRNPQTIMPPFGRNLILNDNEISAIVDFLYTL